MWGLNSKYKRERKEKGGGSRENPQQILQPTNTDTFSHYTPTKSLAKEASQTARSFNSLFLTQISHNLSSDNGSSLIDLLKTHLVICIDKKNDSKMNDLIYNVIVPSVE